MKIFYKTVLFFIVLLLFSCSYSETFHEVKVDGRYALSFPDYMEAAEADKPLNPKASLQYLNYFRNIYAVVIEQPKTNTIKDLQSFQQQAESELLQHLSAPQRLDSTATTINGLPALQMAFAGVVNGTQETDTKIYYRMAFVEGKTQFYQITLWTWYDWREKYEEEIQKIFNSFRLITN